MKKVVAYARISNEDQSNFSISGQVEKITEYCYRNNYELVDTFIDEGQSAKDFDRKAWKRLENFLKLNHKHIDYFVVLKYDRFSRNLQQALTVIQKFEEDYDIKILSINEPIAIPPENPFYFQMRTTMLMQAQVERMVIKDRTIFGINRAKKEGRWMGKAPFGYRNERDNSGKPIITVDYYEAALVKMIFELYLQNYSYAEIKRILLPKGFNKKSKDAIFRILSNYAYIGHIKVKLEDKTETYIPGIHESIIEEDVFYRVQALIKREGKEVNKYNDIAYLKSSIVCPICSKPMTCSKSKGRTKYYWYYECADHRKSYNAEKANALFDDILDELSFDQLQLDYLKRNIYDMIIDKYKDGLEDVQVLNKKKAALLAKQDNLEEKYLDNKIDDSTYAKWRDKISIDMNLVNSGIEKIKSVESSFDTYLSIAINHLKSLKSVFHMASPQEKMNFVEIGFGKELSYNGKVYRTEYLNPVFKPKTLILKQKELLFVDTKKGILKESPLGVGSERLTEPYEDLLLWIQKNHKSA